MEFNLSVIQVDKIQKLDSRQKPYLQLEVSYKDITQQKIMSKKLMPFGNTQTVHKVFSEAKNGDLFTVKTEKNGATGYWDWLEAKQAAPGTAEMKAATPAPKSTYETPEERAKKQVYIIKQSSLSAAIQLLTVGAKAPPSTETIIQEAQKFTDWVLGQDSPVTTFADMKDDFPE